jgi:dTMP kinase
MPRGLFLSLDGLDGGGKSTQCRLLAAWLRGCGYTVTYCVDPSPQVIGGTLRELILHRYYPLTPTCEALLFMASRAQLVAEIIRPALDAAHIVISDRYLLANVVYQGYAGGLDVEQLWQVGRLSTGGVEPALTFVLDLPPEQARSRRSGPTDRVESRPPDYHARVRHGFQTEAQRHPDRILVVDASQPIESVHAAICQAVRTHLEKGSCDVMAARQGT